jgi:molybdopterin-binding protein
MKATIVSVILLLFTMNVIIVLAEEETDSDKVNWVSGVVESIQSGKENSLVSVTMTNGENFNFSSNNDKMEGIQVGDSISSKVANGWAESIEKLEKPVEIAKPKKDSGEPQWVSGEITAIQTGKENSLVSVKMQNGENFNFSATNQMLLGIMVGDRVTAKVNKGWAETIATNGGHF